MKKMKRDRVPVIEDTLGLNLAKLQATAKKVGSDTLAITWQGTTGLVIMEPERMVLAFGGVTISADIVTVACLNGRLRSLLKCSRAHVGNFQTLYLRGGELACRQCHGLRYRSTLAAGPVERARLARFKVLDRMGGLPGEAAPVRRSRAWRKRYLRLVGRLLALSGVHYADLRQQLAQYSSERFRNANHSAVPEMDLQDIVR